MINLYKLREALGLFAALSWVTLRFLVVVWLAAQVRESPARVVVYLFAAVDLASTLEIARRQIRDLLRSERHASVLPAPVMPEPVAELNAYFEEDERAGLSRWARCHHLNADFAPPFGAVTLSASADPYAANETAMVCPACLEYLRGMVAPHLVKP